MASRVLPLIIGALSILFAGLVSLQMQVDQTGANVNFSASPERVNDSWNMSRGVLADVTTTFGIGLPGLFAAVVLAFVGVMLVVVLR